MIRWPCWMMIQSGGSDTKPACTFLTMIAPNILWISLQPVSMLNAFRRPFPGVALAFQPRSMKAARHCSLQAAFPKSIRIAASRAWSPSGGGLRSIRVVSAGHQIPPMRAPHNTTKAVRVNMRTAGESSIRAASQQNFSPANHAAQFRKNRGTHSCKLPASSVQSNPGRRKKVGATVLHETRQSLRGG